MEDVPTTSAWIDRWKPEIDLTSPAGEMLRRMVALAPPDSMITLFGSAPLQLSLDRDFLSADIDCIAPAGFADRIRAAGLDNVGLPLYVQVCDSLSFRTSSVWQDRAYIFPLDGRLVRIPHPIDILIGKLNRMDAKDFKAFEMVRERTGHPTEDELIRELQNAVDLYLPSFDEAQGRDVGTATRMLWQDFFGKDIDVAAVIIGPAQQRRRASYARDHSRTDHKSALKGL